MKVAKRKAGDLELIQCASEDGEAAIQTVKRGKGYVYKARRPGKVVVACDDPGEAVELASLEHPKLSAQFDEALFKLLHVVH